MRWVMGSLSWQAWNGSDQSPGQLPMSMIGCANAMALIRAFELLRDGSWTVFEKANTRKMVARIELSSSMGSGPYYRGPELDGRPLKREDQDLAPRDYRDDSTATGCSKSPTLTGVVCGRGRNPAL